MTAEQADATSTGLRLAGRHIIVTGGARGIGHATAERLLADGATVALVDIEEHAVQVAVENLDSERVRPEVLDLTSAEQVDDLVRRLVVDWGRIDGLVNNAGIAGPSKPVWQYDDDEWSAVLAVNLTAIFFLCRAVLPVMLDQGGGRIVNIASIAGKEGNPNMTAYSSSKAAVLGFTKAVAKEVAQRGIYVNAITPAVVETEILQQLEPETVNYMVQRIPMGRTGKPHEIAAMVAWLCSDECSFSTGAVFDISGGRATY